MEHRFFTFSRAFSGALLVPTDTANGRYTIYIIILFYFILYQNILYYLYYIILKYFIIL